jgi:hypothetical protein
MTLSKVHPATMNTMKLAAILLFGLGISIFAYQGVRDKKGVAGPSRVTEPSDNLLLLPMVGGIALFGGAVLLFAGDRRR